MTYLIQQILGFLVVALAIGGIFGWFIGRSGKAALQETIADLQAQLAAKKTGTPIEAIELQPKMKGCHFYLGNIAVKNADYATAVSEFEAIRLEGEDETKEEEEAPAKDLTEEDYLASATQDHADLAAAIAAAAGFEGETVWDASMPDGQMKRGLDVSRARELTGFEAEVPLEDGVERTVEWFREHQLAAV